MKQSLKEYQKWLLAYKAAHPISGRPETPDFLNIKTLWIPTYSSNRTASIDLNHSISSDEDMSQYIWYVPEYTQCIGYNGNCGTAYAIIPVPLQFREQDIDTLAEMVCRELGKNYGIGSERRVLKADSRMSVIIDCLNIMFK